MKLILPPPPAPGAAQINLLISTRLAGAAARRGLAFVHLLCRPAEPASPRHDRHRPRHHPASHHLAPARRRGRTRKRWKRRDRGIELALFLTLPAIAALVIVAAEPIVRGLFQHGALQPPRRHVHCALALAGFSVGLPAYILVEGANARLLCARTDIKTPVRYAERSRVAREHRAQSRADPCRSQRHMRPAARLPRSRPGVNAVHALSRTLSRRGHFAADAQLKRRRLPGARSAPLDGRWALFMF